MKKTYVTLFFVITAFLSSAQSNKSSAEEETSRYRTLLSTSNKTLIINLSNYTLNFIGEFKDELIGWKEKVISVDINESTKIISIIHNQLLDPKEISDVLSKYQIDKGLIISHN